MSVHLRIAIAGSRTITDYNQLLIAIQRAIDANVITPAHSFEIVSGGAKGVDTLARQYAYNLNYKLVEFRPQYLHNNDRGAPLRRNKDIAEYSDVLVAIWDNKSRGTENMINHMRKLGKPVYIHLI